MKKYAQTYTLFLMFVSCTLCEGQNKTDLPTGNIKPEIKDVITSNGPTSTIRNITQDRKGDLWFGSFGSGVYYYDGKSFQNFTTKEGLVSNEIVCIYD